ncbi:MULTISPECIES: GNAT family N-acetyltransferase [Sulfurimonas]|uniref:GNAT family N-acetyltransferase n=1 Tax=Sulfurimonas diazotrophicus TaxID=3131939 RepID=A0ABZ3HCY6_9BACT
MHIVPVTTPEQAALCASLAETIWREFYTPIIGAEQVEYMLRSFQSADAINAQMQNGYHYTLLYDGETAVGYCATVPEDDVLKVSKLYVLQTQRGKGGGRLMLEHCAAEAKAGGFKRLLLTVNRHNPSVAFYEHEGFTNAGPLVQGIGGGFVMDDYVMVRPVR